MEIILYLQSFKNPFMDVFFQAVTMSGEGGVFLLIICWLIWCGDKSKGWRIGWIFLSGFILNGSVKDIFQVQRPIGHPDIITLRAETANGYSFPSGHAQGTAMLWVSMMIIYRNKIICLFGGLLILLVGLSRMYLGVHWPTDVLGGVIIGTVWVFTADYIWNRFNISGSVFKITAVSVLMILCSAFFYDNNIARSSGALTGFLSGIFIEERYIKYIPSGSMGALLLKLLSGILVIIALILCLKKMLPDNTLFKGVNYAIAGFWITAGAPYCFKIFSGLKKK
jgi:membrane-associated phospholipid phosphatase